MHPESKIHGVHKKTKFETHVAVLLKRLNNTPKQVSVYDITGDTVWLDFTCNRFGPARSSKNGVGPNRMHV